MYLKASRLFPEKKLLLISLARHLLSEVHLKSPEMNVAVCRKEELCSDLIPNLRR